MANLNLYGSNYTKAFVNVPSQKIEPGEHVGKVKVAYDEYDLDDLGVVLADGDLIYMMKMPKGARILEAVIHCPDLGTAGIINLGTAADPDRYIAALDGGLSAAAKGEMGAGVAGAFEEFSVDTQLLIKCTEASIAITGVIKVAVYYVMD